jgi:hypothetical protein
MEWEESTGKTALLASCRFDVMVGLFLLPCTNADGKSVGRFDHSLGKIGKRNTAFTLSCLKDLGGRVGIRRLFFALRF